MKTLTVCSAPHLLLSSAAGAPRPTAEDQVGLALLDLRQELPEVAASKLRSVTRGLGPRLFLQEGLRLMVATGELPVSGAAAIVAETLAPLESAPTQLAVVRGENVLDQLEEFMRSGCDLKQNGVGPRLADDRRAPLAAWVASPVEPITEALQQGATIVLTQHATPSTLLRAVASDRFGTPFEELSVFSEVAQQIQAKPRQQVTIDPVQLQATQSIDQATDRVPLNLEFAEEQELVVRLSPAGDRAAFVAACQAEIASELRVEVNTAGEDWILRVHGPVAAAWPAAMQRVELLCDPASGGPHMKERRDQSPKKIRVLWQTTVPADRLEFGYDSRLMPEWR